MKNLAQFRLYAQMWFAGFERIVPDLYIPHTACEECHRLSPVKSRSRHLEWELQTEDFRVAVTAGATDNAA